MTEMKIYYHEFQEKMWKMMRTGHDIFCFAVQRAHYLIRKQFVGLHRHIPQGPDNQHSPDSVCSMVRFPCIFLYGCGYGIM